MHKAESDRLFGLRLMAAPIAMMAALMLLFPHPMGATESSTRTDLESAYAGTLSADLAPEAFLQPHQGQVSAPQPDERPHHRTRTPFPCPTLGASLCGSPAAAGSNAETPPTAGLGLIGTDIIYPFHGFW